MINQKKLIGYAEDFISFLVSGDYLDGYTVRNIILYGSVARGDFTKGSDIDFFIDVLNPDKKLEQNTKRALEEFPSSIWFNKWKRLGIANEINCLSGRLEEWKNLQRSMVSDGIVLYGKYKLETSGDIVTMFLISRIKPEKKRVFITRKLFGYRKSGKHYSGMVERLGGEKLSSGCFIIPAQFSGKISNHLKEKRIKFRVKEFAKI